MNDQLDHGIRTMLDELVARAPTANSQPTTVRVSDLGRAHRRPALAIAAAFLVVAGIGGIYAVKSRNSTKPPAQPAASAAPTSAQPAATNPSGRANGAITDPKAVDFGQWLNGAPGWPTGQPADYLVFDVTNLEGWSQLDQTGGHQMGDGPSYHWSSNVADPDGRQFNLTVSDSVRYPRLVNGEEVDINGIVGVTFQGDVSWPIDATHIGTVTEFGTAKTERVVALARQLNTTTVSTLAGMIPPGPTITTDPAAAFSGIVQGVSWSASGTPDEIRFAVAGTSAETYGGDSAYRLANQPAVVTAVGSSLCVLIAGYVPDAQTSVQLILSDGIMIGLPTQPLEDGEQWFGACVPYELDAVSVEIARPNQPEPDRYALNGPFMQPSFGSIDLLAA